MVVMGLLSCIIWLGFVVLWVDIELVNDGRVNVEMDKVDIINFL